MTARATNPGRAVTAAEADAFRSAGLPHWWAALYAAPLVAVASEVMNVHCFQWRDARSDRWPWSADAVALPRDIATAALAVVTIAPEVIDATANWVRRVLPPLGYTVGGPVVQTAVEANRGQIVNALDLLAWHLAKDVTASVRRSWLAGCERTGVLAAAPAPVWASRPGYPASPIDEARAVTERLRSLIDDYTPALTYGSDPSRAAPPTGDIALTLLIGVVSELNVSCEHGRPATQRPSWVGLPNEPWARWLKEDAATRLRTNVPEDIARSAADALVSRLADMDKKMRECFLTELGKQVREHSAWRRSVWNGWSGEAEKFAAEFVADLRERVEAKRFRPALPPAASGEPTPAPPVAPLPVSVDSDSPIVVPIIGPTPTVPPAPPAPPPVLEVIEPTDYRTVPLSACLQTAAGLGAADAEWAVGAPLLFARDPNGPKVVVVSGEVPSHLWLIGDIHADILSLENAWQFVRDEAARDGVEPAVVFLGDFIDRGRFDHETLVRLFRIIRDNPGRIGVIAGNHDEALRIDEASGRFASDIEPSEYKDLLNERLDAVGDRGAADAVAVGRAAIYFFRRCPRALLLPDGTLLAHAGFPHVDLQPRLKSPADLEHRDCLQDFAWLRASRSAPRKLPNRLTRGCEFGYKDFADFCRVLGEMALTVRRLVRGHDHLPERCGLPPRYADHPVLTINTIGRRLADEFNPEAFPKACVARYWPDRLPTVYRLPIDPAEVTRAFPPGRPV